jgi:hypothetical protein
MDDLHFSSIVDVFQYLYSHSLNKTSFRFRGQSNFSWNLQPTVYRFEKFKRYQTVAFEHYILKEKPKKPEPPLTYTNFDLEWLMLCQHYSVPTRLLDWTNEILIALFFSCYNENEINSDGALFICDQNDYPLYSNFNEQIMNLQNLAFIDTNVTNPRMRTQAGCFMIWGHSQLDTIGSKESYDLWQFHEKKMNSHLLKKIRIPNESKKQILNDLNVQYLINEESIFLKNGFLEKTYGLRFKQLKGLARLKTLYVTDAERLNAMERFIARSLFPIECENMFKDCFNLNNISGGL